VFSGALEHTHEGQLPTGQWTTALVTRFDRAMYVFSMETTAADDATIIAAFNSAPKIRSRRKQAEGHRPPRGRFEGAVASS
jgi:hypothetical protein